MDTRKAPLQPATEFVTMTLGSTGQRLFYMRWGLLGHWHRISEKSANKALRGGAVFEKGAKVTSW